jgi:hypothetical protein
LFSYKPHCNKLRYTYNIHRQYLYNPAVTSFSRTHTLLAGVALSAEDRRRAVRWPRLCIVTGFGCDDVPTASPQKRRGRRCVALRRRNKDRNIICPGIFFNRSSPIARPCCAGRRAANSVVGPLDPSKQGTALCTHRCTRAGAEWWNKQSIQISRRRHPHAALWSGGRRC